MIVADHSPMKERRKSFLLRIDQDLWDELSSWASQDFRSVNGQIELILRQAVNEHKKRRRGSQDESRHG